MKRGLLILAACLVIFPTPASPSAGPDPVAAQTSPYTLKPDLSIGIEEGEDDLMFGSITRIDLDGKGNIHILDYKMRRIVVCDPDGRHLRTIAVPAGQGPREATNISGIAVTPGGTLFINDGRKIIVYGPDGEFILSFKTDFMISSIGCPGTEELVAIGPKNGRILHVFDKDGKLLESFGETFTPPSDLLPMKDMPMFGAPLLFNSSKDGRMFVLNPHKYEVSVFRDRRLEEVITGRNEHFQPIQRKGRGFISTAAYIVALGETVFVCFQAPPVLGQQPPIAWHKADIFLLGKQVGSIDFPGTPHVVDSQGRIYYAEEEDFPRVVRYTLIN